MNAGYAAIIFVAMAAGAALYRWLEEPPRLGSVAANGDAANQHILPDILIVQFRYRQIIFTRQPRQDRLKMGAFFF